MNPTHGGPCQGIRYSIPEMERLGVFNEVVCLDDPDSPFISSDPFIVHALGKGRGPWQYSGNLIPWLKHNFHRFDIVIVHGIWLFHSFAVRIALKKFKKLNHSRAPKWYIMPHGMLDPYFQRASGRKFKSLRNWLYWKMIEGKVVNEADGILFTCEEELKLAKIPFDPYHPIREINVGYGIAAPPQSSKIIINAFYRLIPELEYQNFLLFISRIHEKKGIDILLKGYVQMWKKYNSTNNISKPPLLVIAGPGIESEYGKKIKNMAETLAPRNSVFFPGMLSGNEKWGAFYSCESFILPSHQENFGIAVIEALACGKPVLISNQINIWREIEKDQAGLVAGDNLEGIHKLIEKWIKFSDEEKEIMGINARSCFENNFSISISSRNLYKALQF